MLNRYYVDATQPYAYLETTNFDKEWCEAITMISEEMTKDKVLDWLRVLDTLSLVVKPYLVDLKVPFTLKIIDHCMAYLKAAKIDKAKYPEFNAIKEELCRNLSKAALLLTTESKRLTLDYSIMGAMKMSAECVVDAAKHSEVNTKDIYSQTFDYYAESLLQLINVHIEPITDTIH